MEQANVTTINGKPYEQPKGPPYTTQEQLLADLETTGDMVDDLTAERDELARRLAAIKSQLGTGGAAEARRALARVLTSVMSEKNLDAVFVCGELATAMDYLEVAEAAEDYAAEDYAAEVSR